MSGDLRKLGMRGWRAIPAIYAAAPSFCVRELHSLPPQSFGVFCEASDGVLLGNGEGVAPCAPVMACVETGRAAARAASEGVQARERERRRQQMSLSAGVRARRMQADATARRRQSTGWLRMVTAGQVGDREATAAQHLIKVHELLQAGALARTDHEAMLAGGVVVSGRPGAPQASAVAGYADVYLPWLQSLSLSSCRLGPRGLYSGDQALKLTLAFVVEGKTLAEASKIAKMKKANATGLLMEALRKYASILSNYL